MNTSTNLHTLQMHTPLRVHFTTVGERLFWESTTDYEQCRDKVQVIPLWRLIAAYGKFFQSKVELEQDSRSYWDFLFESITVLDTSTNVSVIDKEQD